jgi:hypothetical protein
VSFFQALQPVSGSVDFIHNFPAMSAVFKTPAPAAWTTDHEHRIWLERWWSAGKRLSPPKQRIDIAKSSRKNYAFSGKPFTWPQDNAREANAQRFRSSRTKISHEGLHLCIYSALRYPAVSLQKA